MSKPIAPQNCPINEQTPDGSRTFGRCWHFLGDDDKCPRHGDVSKEAAHYRKTGRLTPESKRDT